MARDFGDESGVFWLPSPTPPRRSGGKGGNGTVVRVRKPVGPPPDSHWQPPLVLPRLSGVVALDFETRDPRLKVVGPNWCRPVVGEVVGFALAWEGGELYYPLNHEGGDNCNPDTGWSYLRDVATNPDVQLVAHNALYELGWLWGRYGIKPARVMWDTQAAVALLDEYRQRNNQGYNLNAVGRDYCGILKDETLLRQAADYFGLDAKSDLWKLPARYVGPYAEGDAGLCLDIWHVLEPQLRDQGLWDLFVLEMRYAVVVTAMRARGIRVDIPRAEWLRDDLKRREREAAARIKALVGFEVPVWEAATVARALDKAGIDYPHTATGKPSFTKEWLRARTSDPLIRDIANIRRWEKARATFVEGFFLELSHNGRIHPQINPLPTDDSGAVSGRSSCEKPNVQQLSAKDKEIAPEVRGLCLPEEGAEWAALDYSQQEPRLLVHFAHLAEVPGARQMVEAYLENPRLDLHQKTGDLAGIGRGQAKILNLALTYGKGEAATCHELGFETELVKVRNGRTVEVAGPEGKAFLQNYYRIVPVVPGMKEACARAVKRKGYIRTLLGRRCRFGDGKAKPHMAVNRLIQGSAADQLKKANVDMYEQLGEVPLVNVHDENGVNKWSDQQIRNVEQAMLDTTPLVVPMVVDVAVGKNWGEAL